MEFAFHLFFVSVSTVSNLGAVRRGANQRRMNVSQDRDLTLEQFTVILCLVKSCIALVSRECN